MLLRRDFLQYAGLVGIVHCGPLDRQGQTSKPCAIDLATPPAKFDSSHNYFMRGDDERIRGLVVTVEVEEAIVSSKGMSFQLNVQSPKNAVCYWQQYTMGVNPIAGQGLQIGWTIENWGTKDYVDQLIAAGDMTCRAESLVGGVCKNEPVLNAGMDSFAPYPDVDNNTIPAGFKLRFQLLNNERGIITGVKYGVTRKGGKDYDYAPPPLASYALFRATHPKVNVPEAVLQANAGFQMNIVGFHRSETTHMSSGAGKIIYESETQIHPVGAFPGATWTGEQSNLKYSELPFGSAKRIVQKFGRDLASHKATGYGPSQPNCSGNEVYNPATKTCMPPTGTTKDKDKY